MSLLMGKKGPFRWRIIVGIVVLGIYACPTSWHREWHMALGTYYRYWHEHLPSLVQNDSAGRVDEEEKTENNAYIARLLNENAILRETLANVEIARERYPLVRFIEVMIIPESFQDPEGALLDKGSEDGILPRAVVISKGALLGTVTRVGAKTSWMRYISSSDSHIPAKAIPATPSAANNSSTGELCLLSGIGEEGEGEGAEVSFYAMETQAKTDWLILTTSDGDWQLPEGILVGTMTTDPADTGESGVKTAKVRLDSSKWKTSTALVMKELRQ